MLPDTKEPQILGEIGYFAGGRRIITLTAKEDCEMLHFKDINSLFHAVQKRPGWIQMMIVKLKNLGIQPKEHNPGQYTRTNQETIFGTTSKEP